MPFWLLMIGFGTPLFIVVRRQLIEDARQGTPICGQCDYDLTGNTSGICPECGTKIPVLSVQAADDRVSSPG